MIRYTKYRESWTLILFFITLWWLVSWLKFPPVGSALNILRLSDLLSLVPDFLSSLRSTSISTLSPLCLSISRTWFIVKSMRLWPLIRIILSPVLNLPSLSITLPGSMWAMMKPLVLELLVIITPRLSSSGFITDIRWKTTVKSLKNVQADKYCNFQLEC